VNDHYHNYDDRAGTLDYASLGGGNDRYRKQGADLLGNFATSGAVLYPPETQLVKPAGVNVAGGNYNFPPFYTLAYYIRFN
jgi:hypothetical protein